MAALARRTKALIRSEMPDVVEVVWPRQRIAGYGVGPKKQSEHFCYIGIYERHLNLGFNYGAELPDPQGLLEGTGKLLRHVKIRTVDDLERSALRELLLAASTHRMPARPTGQALDDASRARRCSPVLCQQSPYGFCTVRSAAAGVAVPVL